MPHHDTTDAQGHVFFSKQPILDADRRIWGYELLGGEVRQGIFRVFPKQESTAASLSSSTFYGLQEAMARGKRVMIAFDADSIREGQANALPAGLGWVHLALDAKPDAALLKTLAELRAEGYGVALDVTPGSPSLAAAKQADVLVMEHAPGALAPAFARLVAKQAEMLARGVRSLEQFQTARDQGYTLFQGPFFKEPEMVPGRKLTSNEVSRLQMLRLLEAKDPDPEGLAAAIKGDVAVSFRLLTLLNSPAFGLLQKVESVDHAVRLLGWSKLKSWLRAVLLVDMSGQGEAPQELAALSMQRGRFLELITAEYDYWGFNPETMFLLGMFSLLDTILGMPMAEVVELLPLDAKLKASLRRDPGNDHQSLFDLITSLEDGDWPAFQDMAGRLGFEQEVVKTSYAAAMEWTGVFFAAK